MFTVATTEIGNLGVKWMGTGTGKVCLPSPIKLYDVRFSFLITVVMFRWRPRCPGAGSHDTRRNGRVLKITFLYVNIKSD